MLMTDAVAQDITVAVAVQAQEPLSGHQPVAKVAQREQWAERAEAAVPQQPLHILEFQVVQEPHQRKELFFTVLQPPPLEVREPRAFTVTVTFTEQVAAVAATEPGEEMDTIHQKPPVLLSITGTIMAVAAVAAVSLAVQAGKAAVTGDMDMVQAVAVPVR